MANHDSHDPIYDELAASAEFAELKTRYKSFVIPATAIFLLWYGLYVVMSMFAQGFMSTTIVGNINVALIFGLLQFVTTFGIAALYSRYSNGKLDPLAQTLEQRFTQGRGTQQGGN